MAAPGRRSLAYIPVPLLLRPQLRTASQNDYIWSELVWGKHRDDQNVFYLHGALPLFDDGVCSDQARKSTTSTTTCCRKSERGWESAEYPIFVTASAGRQKLTHIMHNHYLAHSYESLCTADGSLVTFGFNFGK